MALASDRWDSEASSVTPDEGAARLVHRYLLVLRFALVNVLATGLLAAIYMQGWLDDALLGYTLWLSLIIVSVFVFGLVLCAVKVWRTSIELNGVRAGMPGAGSRAGKYFATIEHGTADSRSIVANVLRLRLTSYISVVHHIANTLVFLGLVGTVIGFIVALSGVDPGSAATAENVAPMVATLVRGMSIALYTTLIGAVLHVWLMINYRLLASGTVYLFNAIVEFGERRVGA
ncbi:MAG: MotA/TolQ/ExbB proton channel family protein [Acidiferrobacterales bacterium]